MRPVGFEFDRVVLEPPFPRCAGRSPPSQPDTTAPPITSGKASRLQSWPHSRRPEAGRPGAGEGSWFSFRGFLVAQQLGIHRIANAVQAKDVHFLNSRPVRSLGTQMCTSVSSQCVVHLAARHAGSGRSPPCRARAPLQWQPVHCRSCHWWKWQPARHRAGPAHALGAKKSR